MPSILTLRNQPVLTAVIAIFLTISCKKTAEKPEEIPLDPNTNKTWKVSTMAGSGNWGATDGADSVAEFKQPAYIAINNSGEVFVSDFGNYTIRKISNHQVTTYTGPGISTSSTPWDIMFGMAFDNQNNLYGIEKSFIRKVSSASSSDLFVGGLESYYKDGVGNDARFSKINRIVADKKGNLYLPDYNSAEHFLIRKITPAGIVSTVLINDNTGIPSGSNFSYYFFCALAVDIYDNIYFTAHGNSIIKKVDTKGNVIVLAGNGTQGLTDGIGVRAQFNNITALAADAYGNVYVTDASNNAIRKVTRDGVVTTIAGTGQPGFADGEGKNAMFDFPNDLVVDKNGIVYVADGRNYRIRKLEPK